MKKSTQEKLFKALDFLDSPKFTLWLSIVSCVVSITALAVRLWK